MGPIPLSRRLNSLYRPFHRLYSSSAEAPIRITNLATPTVGHIRILELNRPDARNAISRALLTSLSTEINAIQAQYTPDGIPTSTTHGDSTSPLGPTRAVIIASAIDSCFCAGADLKERLTFTPQQTADFLHHLRQTLASLASLPIPSISAISSLALGGGLELALATHFRVLTSNATVGLPETRLGIIPGAGGTHRLPALIGLARARDLILTGRRVAAPEAYFLGIADRLVQLVPDDADSKASSPPDKTILPQARKLALTEAVRLAHEITQGGAIAVRAALQAVAWATPEKEAEMYQRTLTSNDRVEALKAFQDKRKPVFKDF
ncbi:hypothetical protein CDD82_2425 [Ophiocordyceps australis]|uniref:Enoyl-CoA hydratase n=1 Tax=Ophiocordyceps australis TaxID=1399860 RepID=A0A2C5ZH87_9HYPO|nr:hypothetical protein CDD82_2425 [Ophiocordyceps australis]